MTDAAAKTDTAALVVFGQTDKGARHAAWFTAVEGAQARKAAALASLVVLDPIPEAIIPLLPKIARGRMVMGQVSLSKVAPEVFEALQACVPAEGDKVRAEGAATVEQPTVLQPTDTAALPPAPPAPASRGAELWQRLKIGDPVLASYEGWWRARILAIYPDRVRLAWEGDEPGEYDEVPRSKIALLFPPA